MKQSKKLGRDSGLAGDVASVRENTARNILYISFTGRTERPYLDPSTRYRCFYPVEAARALGHRAFVATQAALATVDPLLFDLIIIHRPAFTPDLVRFVRAARAGGVRLAADYDDLIFDPAYAAASSMFLKSWDYTAALSTFERNTDALRLFGEFTVSTAPLKEHVHALHPQAEVSVLPNSVPSTLWSQIAGRAYEDWVDRPYVGYFPGTATHESDFRVAAEAVAEFCRERAATLRIVGPLQPDEAAFRGVAVERIGLQPFGQMFDTLAGCRVVLAPLAPSPFNRAKSHIKLLESTLACTACVASAIPDMAQHGGASPVCLVDDAAGWPDAVRKAWDGFDLPANARLRAEMVDRFAATAVYAPLFAPPFAQAA